MKELSSDFEVSTQTRSTVDLVCLKTSRSLLNPFIYCGAKIASNQAPCWPGWIFRAGGAPFLCIARWALHGRHYGRLLARACSRQQRLLRDNLEGGGACYDEVTCTRRSTTRLTTRLGSSSYWNKMHTGNFALRGLQLQLGLLLRDCGPRPVLHPRHAPRQQYLTVGLVMGLLL